jgi:hypothetical protein
MKWQGKLVGVDLRRIRETIEQPQTASWRVPAILVSCSSPAARSFVTCGRVHRVFFIVLTVTVEQFGGRPREVVAFEVNGLV